MAASPDYYEVLQVSPNADAEVIQAAYRRLSLKWHPDRNPGNPFAHARMNLLNEAYEVLSDQQKRQEYDSRRKRSAASEEETRKAPRATDEGATSEGAEKAKATSEGNAAVSEPNAAPLSDVSPKSVVRGQRWSVVAILALVVAWWAAPDPDPPPPPSQPTPDSHDPIESLRAMLADVRLSGRSDDFGRIHGTVHNGSQQPIRTLKLSIKTARWERVYEVPVWVKYGTTVSFSVYVGDPLLEVENFVVSGVQVGDVTQGK